MELISLKQIILIAIGGAIGSVSRYLTSLGVFTFVSRSFPFGTLAVNIIGSFIMGFLTVLIIERYNGIAAELRSLLLIGFLGGYTTFSSFSIETLNLFENGEMGYAILNVLFSVILCLGAVWLGAIIGRQL